jgi:ABC-type dipeptide/oligopeptide/nickel transport system ATPase subunit
MQVEKSSLIRTENLRLAGCAPLGQDLEICTGARIGILGMPGSGKTKLLRTLAHLDPISEGRLFWGKLDVSKRPRWSLRGRQRSFVKLILANPYTSLEPWALVERFLKVNVPQSATKQILQRFGLTPAMQPHRIKALSGTARLHLACAYAMLSEPDVLLLDDVFNALVPEVWHSSLIALLSAIGESCAVIVASRHQRVVQSLDNVYSLKEGVLV